MPSETESLAVQLVRALYDAPDGHPMYLCLAAITDESNFCLQCWREAIKNRIRAGRRNLIGVQKHQSFSQ
jgi:hypothetical protein